MIGFVADFNPSKYCETEKRVVARLAEAVSYHEDVLIFSSYQYPFGTVHPVQSLPDFNLDVLVWGNYTAVCPNQARASKQYVYCYSAIEFPEMDIITSTFPQSVVSGRVIYTTVPFEKSFERENKGFVLISGCVHPRRRLDVAVDAFRLANIGCKLKIVYNPYKTYYIENLSCNNDDEKRTTKYYEYYNTRLSFLDGDVEEIDELLPTEFEELMSSADTYIYTGVGVNLLTTTEALCYGVKTIIPCGSYQYCSVPLVYQLDCIPFNTIYEITQLLNKRGIYEECYRKMGRFLSMELTFKEVGAKLLNQL